MPPIDEHTPHKALLALHGLVGEGIAPLIEPIGLTHATETIVTVDRYDLDALGQQFDPQAVLVNLDGGPAEPSVLIAEPALCNTLLTRIWRGHRDPEAPLTQVESAILQQFLSDVCNQWRSAWRRAGIPCLPTLTLAATLSLLAPQMTDGPWYVARTVILDGNDAVGVLLFCYPAAAIPVLVEARESIRWRARLDRPTGLTDDEREALQRQLARLKDVVMPVPVAMHTDIPLAVINQLEVGDVIAFDAPVGGDMDVTLLDREATARLGRHDGNFAIVLTGPQAELQYDPSQYEDPYASGEPEYDPNATPEKQY